MSSSTAEGMDTFGGTIDNIVSQNTMNSPTAQSMGDKDFMDFPNIINTFDGAHFSGSLGRVTKPVFRIISKNVRGLGTEDRLR